MEKKTCLYLRKAARWYLWNLLPKENIRKKKKIHTVKNKEDDSFKFWEEQDHSFNPGVVSQWIKEINEQICVWLFPTLRQYAFQRPENLQFENLQLSYNLQNKSWLKTLSELVHFLGNLAIPSGKFFPSHLSSHSALWNGYPYIQGPFSSPRLQTVSNRWSVWKEGWALSFPHCSFARVEVGSYLLYHENLHCTPC